MYQTSHRHVYVAKSPIKFPEGSLLISHLSSFFGHHRAKNCPTLPKINRVPENLLYECKYQIWVICIFAAVINECQKKLFNCFCSIVGHRVPIAMKLNLYVLCHHVYTKFQIDKSQHVEINKVCKTRTNRRADGRNHGIIPSFSNGCIKITILEPLFFN